MVLCGGWRDDMRLAVINPGDCRDFSIRVALRWWTWQRGAWWRRSIRISHCRWFRIWIMLLEAWEVRTTTSWWQSSCTPLACLDMVSQAVCASPGDWFTLPGSVWVTDILYSKMDHKETRLNFYMFYVSMLLYQFFMPGLPILMLRRMFDVTNPHLVAFWLTRETNMLDSPQHFGCFFTSVVHTPDQFHLWCKMWHNGRWLWQKSEHKHDKVTTRNWHQTYTVHTHTHSNYSWP